MSKGGLMKRVGDALRGLGIRPPWAFTGPVSTPEYLNHLPVATEYRKHAPGSQPLRAVVPQAEPDRIYDIKYFVRDTRRAEGPGGTKVLARYQLDPKVKDEALEATPVPTPNKTHRWTKPRSILDHDNNGYTV
ncbi:hypothetical protein N2152v2_006689 [Parachlorella kessleri]